MVGVCILQRSRYPWKREKEECGHPLNTTGLVFRLERKLSQRFVHPGFANSPLFYPVVNPGRCPLMSALQGGDITNVIMPDAADKAGERGR